MIRVNLVRWSSARFFLLWMSQCSVDVGNLLRLLSVGLVWPTATVRHSLIGDLTTSHITLDPLDPDV